MSSFPNIKPDADFIQQQLQLNNEKEHDLRKLQDLLNNLITNEEKAKEELQAVREQCVVLKLQYDGEKNHRSRAENQVGQLKLELEKIVSENRALKEKFNDLTGEKNVFKQRAEILEEMDKGWMEKVHEANKRMTDIEREKNVAVAELNIQKRKFIELEKRVTVLECDAFSLKMLVETKNADGQRGNLPTKAAQPPTSNFVIIDSDDEAPPEKKKATNLHGTQSQKRPYFSFAETNLKAENVDYADVMDSNSPNNRFKSMKFQDFTPRSGTSANNNAEKRSTESPFSHLFSKCVSDYSSRTSSSDAKVNKIWGSVEEMRTDFEKSDELPLMAVCALYRQRVFVQNLSPHSNDRVGSLEVRRGKQLAAFLTEGNQQGQLTKSSKDLLKHDPMGLVDCRRLALGLSQQLFEMYKKQGYSLFHP